MTHQKPNKLPSLKEKEEDLARQLLEALDAFLSAGDWEATLFLKANKKRLEALRGRAQALLDQVQQSEQLPKQAIREAPPGYQMVYISIFQAESNNLTKWQGTIKSLERYSVSRAIYREEEHIRALIRNKPDPSREAYVVAFVKETDIVKPYLGKKVQDQLGHELLTLRERAVDLNHVIEFVHNHKRYHYSPERGLLLL